MPFDERTPSRPGGTFFPLLLSVSVYSFGVFLLLWRGLYKQSLYAAAFALLGLVATRRLDWRLERPFLALLILGLGLFAQGYLQAGERISGNFHEVLLWFLLMTFAVTRLPERFGNQRAPDHGEVCATLLVASVAIQIVAHLLGINKAGLFSNIHMLALYSVITLPLLFYLAAGAKRGLRWLFILALLGDFWLLMKTQSRPGFLALLAGSLTVVPLLPPRRRLAALGAALLVPAALYGSGAFGFAARIDELIAHFAHEERLAIWRETLLLQQTSTPMEWIIGHGFGRFLFDYQPYSSFHYMEDYPCPHNFILELLYSHGVVGVILVTAAYIALYRILLQVLAETGDPTRKQLAVLFVCIITTQFIHTFLTLPFFSRPSLYPLSLILGAIFRFLRADSAGKNTPDETPLRAHGITH